jgi:hypothetical protein
MVCPGGVQGRDPVECAGCGARGWNIDCWPSCLRRSSVLPVPSPVLGVGGCGTSGGVGGAVLARCWVLRERTVCVPLGAPCWLRGVRGPSSRWNRFGWCWWPVGVGAGVGEGVARSLRTAQWTRASLNLCSQVFKGTRWMPWHQEPMKDVGTCDKPRGVGNRTVIRGFPNGETRLDSSPVTHA